METFLKRLFVENFPRKLFSVVAAIVIWLIVSSSISSTRVFTRVPVRVVNLPPNKTIHGLMPDGFLDKRITVTLTGAKAVIDKMGPQDFDVVLDASNKGDEWVAQITKNNLVSLKSDIQLAPAVTAVAHSELVIHLSRLVSERVPVYILPPKGEAPEGYQFLDVWPRQLQHLVSGPEEDIDQLKETGLELTFDLSLITKEDLDTIRGDNLGEDEISYFVPEEWKKVRIPFLNNTLQPLNSLDSHKLRIDFLYNNLLPLNNPIPVSIFYPSVSIANVNPQTLFLKPGGILKESMGQMLLQMPLYVNDVSRLFLDIVKDHVEIIVIPVVTENTIAFRWDVQFIDCYQLEEAFVTLALSNEYDTDIRTSEAFRQHLSQRESFFRARFREYVRAFTLYVSRDVPLNLSISREPSGGVSISNVSSLVPTETT